MSNFDWLGLAQAITYAHCEAQGLTVSAGTLPALGRSQTSLADEGDSSVASPSELPTAEVHSASAIHGGAVSGNGAGFAVASSAPRYLLAAEIVDNVWERIAERLPDISLEEQHRLEDVEAERESLEPLPTYGRQLP